MNRPLSPATLGILMLACVSLQAQVDFTDDFNRPDGPVDGWSLYSGSWDITGGELRCAVAEGWLWAGAPAITLDGDFTLSMRVDFPFVPGDTVGRHGGLMFFAGSASQRTGNTGYTVDWIDRAEDHGFRLIRWDVDPVILVSGTPQVAEPPALWEVIVAGDQIIVQGDGETVIDIIDGTYRQGHFGLWSYSNTEMHFDDIEIHSGAPGIRACFDATPRSGELPLEVVFDASCSADGEEEAIVSYDWNFGDGRVASGTTASHTYEVADTYNVTLTVTGSAGSQESTSTTIDVFDVDDTPPIDVDRLLSERVQRYGAEADSVVVFNELMYHPATSEDSLEWLELYNQMAVDVDVSNWTIAEGVFYEIPRGTVIPGGGFLVIARNPAALEAETGFAGALGPYTGRLDNDGEDVRLFNRSGREMDGLRFGDGGRWPAAPDGSGVSLAKIDPLSASGPADNWSPSARVGGTPGSTNFPTGGSSSSPPPGLISYWRLEESSGAAIDPYGGNAGSLGSGAVRVAGVVGQGALDLDNTVDAFVNVGPGEGNSFSVSGGITIEAMIEPAWSGALSDADMIFRKEDGDSRLVLGFQHDGNDDGRSFPPLAPGYTGPVLAFGLNVGGNYSELELPLDGEAGRPTLADLKDGQPHHVAATYDATSGEKSIFLDGVLVSSVALAAGADVSSGGAASAYIGNMSGRGQPFTGVLDEVAIWSHALSPAEVEAHYQNALAGLDYLEGEVTTTELPRLAFNEFEITSVSDYSVEIVNHGDVDIQLEGMSLAPGNWAAYVFPSRLLAAGEYLALSRDDLGFDLALDAKLFLFTADGQSVIDSVKLPLGHRGRHPDGTGPWLFPDLLTLGAPNHFTFEDSIVISEIHYHPRIDRSTQPASEPPTSWIELYNRGAETIDLTGWEIDRGIDYNFEPGTLLGPGEYLVVAEDQDTLRALHPGVRIVGNFLNRLSNRSDLILLKDVRGNPADSVEYFDNGRWPEYADGGGASLELRDPFADNSKGEAWAASDETGDTGWRTYSYRQVATANFGPTLWREFVIGLLSAGEILIDDLSVVRSPDSSPVQILQNGDFEGGATAWRILGNHRHSRVIDDPDSPGNKVLHLIATGPTGHMHNHLETTLVGNSPAPNGAVYEVSFRARWLAGSNQFHTRLYFNRIPRTTLIDVPTRSGTPGARNSAFEENIGPTFDRMRHEPVLPDPGEAVSVAAFVEDPDGVRRVTLWWSVAGGGWQSGAMALEPETESLHVGRIPGQSSSSIVQFYVEAEDELGAVSTFPAGGRESRALYKVQDGQARFGPIHNFRIIMTAADASLLHTATNVMSNERLGATVVYREEEVFYDVGCRLKGSQRARLGDSRVSYSVQFHSDALFRGAHRTVSLDRAGGWGIGAGPTGQDEIIVKHAINQASLPGMYDDIAWLVVPRSVQNGPALLMMSKYSSTFLETQFPGDSDGTAYKVELIYYPTTTVDGTPEGLKRPQPDQVVGTDLRDLGDDKEPYRWNFLLENNEDRDDYRRFIELCKAMGANDALFAERLEGLLDIDEATRLYAIISLCGISDTYWFAANFHNVIFQELLTGGRFVILGWDNDVAFTRGTSSALWGGPNLARLYNIPQYQRLFYSHLHNVIDEFFNASYMRRWTDHYGEMAQETGSFNTVLNYVSARSNFARNSLPPRVNFAITTNGGADFTTDDAEVTIEGRGWIDIRSILVAIPGESPEVTWPARDRWRMRVPLFFGENELSFLAFDFAGSLLASDTIVVTSTTGPRPEEFIRGDANGDFAFDISDAIATLLHLFSARELPCRDAADANDDEILNITDAIYSLNAMFRGGDLPPAPFPLPGVDPTGDGSLGCR